MILDCDKEMISSVMDEMIEYVNDEGIVMVCTTSVRVPNEIPLNQIVSDIF